MRILLIGSGGREHALAWAIAASPLCTKLYCAPGNAGIAEQAECVDIKATDLAGLVNFARKKAIDFAVIGPEDPLVLGLADALRAAGIKSFGPSKLAARLEGSKTFTKDFCAKYRIPTGFYQSFTAVEPALAYISAHGAPIVVKADGLAAGKGVTVAMNVAEAQAAVRACLDDKIFGAAGASVLIEEFLDGEEASFFALCDGTTALPLVAAQDHKRIGDGDVGPNTGGMGSYSPAPIFDAAMQERVMAEIVRPTLAGMEKEGCPFQGVLFVGLMIGAAEPKLIEFNVRFGDPECQTMMLRLKSDLLTALLSSAEGALAKFDLRWREQTAITVVMAAPGYPVAPVKGSEIRGLDKAALVPGVTIFHAGTKRDGSKLIAYGGRVLNISAIGADVVEARELAYRAIALIDWPEGIYRRDIGWRAVHRLHTK